MDALEFLKERKRMCRLYKDCYGCPLEEECCVPITNISDGDYQRAVDAVEQWSKEHPCKTRQSVFLERYSRALRDREDIISMCPQYLDGSFKCNSDDGCTKCRREFWMQEVE